jgi:hypothetical protein
MNENGQWSVKGLFFKGDAQVGSFVGKDVVVKDGKLTFVQDYTQKPAGVTWFNGSTITVTPTKDGLTYTWQVGTVTGPPRMLSKGR